jgi:hypothetical protein
MAEVENQLEKNIKCFRYRGREYFSIEFDLLCVEHDIIHDRMLSYSPNQTSLARERTTLLPT